MLRFAAGEAVQAQGSFRKAAQQYKQLSSMFPDRLDYRVSREKRPNTSERDLSIAIAEAESVAAANDVEGAQLYACASIVSLASAIPAKTSAAHAVRRLALLRQAIAKGYADIPGMLADPDLASLRGRADYADLLWDFADTPAAAPTK